jgi:hypothetical protein
MRWVRHTLRCLSGPKNCGRSFTSGTDSQENEKRQVGAALIMPVLGLHHHTAVFAREMWLSVFFIVGIVGIVLPAYFIYVGYLYLVDARNYTLFFCWDETHFLQCNVDAMRAAFLPKDVRQRLESELRGGYERT